MNSVQPLGWKRIAPIFKFGPMLHDLLQANSVSKAVQVFGTPPLFQQLKHFLIPPSVFTQQDDGICDGGAVINVNSTPCVKEEEQKQAVVFEEKHTSSDVSPSPDAVQSPSIGPERPTLLLPYTPTIFPQTSVPGSEKEIQTLNWKYVEDAKMLHQKQTSPQLLRFLKTKANDWGAAQVRAWSEGGADVSASPEPVSAYVGELDRQPKPVPDGAIDTDVPKQDMEIQSHVFKIKRVDSSGSLTYAYVTATPTELWDLGDIFAEAVQEDAEAARVEDKSCGTIKQEDVRSCQNKAVSPHGAPMPAGSGITIPEFQIHRYKETEVVVSYIVSPGDFYIQQVDSINTLQALVTE